ncbi:BCCT family transporter [Halomonas smyrnensis]|uniref:BCCT family transporter n=1 Tax=Halomonas smyrnensis TaxID=720605 RepID=UPI0003015A7B|nr:BCCT family transporter [Halomonas smyrnensis]
MITELSQEGFFSGMHKGMTITAALLVLGFVLFTGVMPQLAGGLFGTTRAWIETTFCGYYLITVMMLLVICAYIVLSRHGDDLPDRVREQLVHHPGRLFERGFGCSPQRFYVERRLAHAHRLLRETRHPITQILERFWQESASRRRKLRC